MSCLQAHLRGGGGGGEASQQICSVSCTHTSSQMTRCVGVWVLMRVGVASPMLLERAAYKPASCSRTVGVHM
jgi:hypothetical protein